jgi:hypothetical protein
MRIKVSILMFASLLFLSAFSAHAQGLTQAVAGPSGDQFQIIVTMAPQTPEDTYKLQSFILTTENVRAGQQPSWFALDLTSTTRNLDTDAKKQKFLSLRWSQTGEVAAQCTQGWIKSTGSEVDKITAVARSLYQIVPVDTKQPFQMQLPKDIEQKISAILGSLETSKMQCVLDGPPDKP